MGELEDMRRARVFDTLLDEIEHWRVAPDAQIRRAMQHDDEVAADLELMTALSDTRIARDEVEFARVRIGRRLDELMRAEPLGAEAARSQPQDARAWARARLRALTAPPAAAVARLRDGDAVETGRTWLRRAAPLVAALLLVVFSSLAGASAASAQALPESPLYAVKRGDEAVLLALSWNDVSKGQTLTMIANHRLSEASAEADLHRLNEARTLLGEFDTTFGQLIDLGAHAQSTHEDNMTLARAIQTTLETEQSIAQHADTHGEKTFAQAATASAHSAVAHIQSVGLKLPTPDTGKGKGNGQGNDQGNDQGVGQPQQTPNPQATHTPHANQGGGKPGSSSTPSTTASPVPGTTAAPTPSPSPYGG